jgi:hypothetical protein
LKTATTTENKSELSVSLLRPDLFALARFAPPPLRHRSSSNNNNNCFFLFDFLCPRFLFFSPEPSLLLSVLNSFSTLERKSPRSSVQKKRIADRVQHIDSRLRQKEEEKLTQ